MTSVEHQRQRHQINAKRSGNPLIGIEHQREAGRMLIEKRLRKPRVVGDRNRHDTKLAARPLRNEALKRRKFFTAAFAPRRPKAQDHRTSGIFIEQGGKTLPAKRGQGTRRHGVQFGDRRLRGKQQRPR